jgi:hypothetical protein
VRERDFQTFKVLWLAHTHHLLGAGTRQFQGQPSHHYRTEEELEPSRRLRRVGAFLRCRNTSVGRRANRHLANRHQRLHAAHPALMDFLAAADGKLCVVFDEAHHSPAPSYAKFLMDLRESYTNMSLLGLTATLCTRMNANKVGWQSCFRKRLSTM